MTPYEYIIVGTIIIAWIFSAIALWVKLNVKLRELDLRMVNLTKEMNTKIIRADENLASHIKWGETEQAKNEIKFNQQTQDLKETQSVLFQKIDKIETKIDTVIQAFSDFKVYCEQNFNG